MTSSEFDPASTLNATVPDPTPYASSTSAEESIQIKKKYKDTIIRLFNSDCMSDVWTCFATRPEGLDNTTVSLLLALLIKYKQISLARELLMSYPNFDVHLKGGAFIALMDAVEDYIKNENDVAIWPDAQLPDAAQTTIYHAQSLIISRQRALINSLLNRF